MTSKTIMTAIAAAVVAGTLLTTGAAGASPDIIADLEAKIQELKDTVAELKDKYNTQKQKVAKAKAQIEQLKDA